jgi:uncharacterized protein (DUF169 family)
MNLKNIHEKSEELMNLLRLKSFPLAVKLLEDEKSIPSESKRPVKDWGYHLDLCQAFSMSRWEEKNIAMLKKDMWCFEPVVGYGLAEPPEDFLKGNNRYPFSAMSQKAGEKWATSLPKMQVGQYIGIVSASLRKCTFEPDVMMVYADPSQITQILIAKNCVDGEDISCSLSGHMAQDNEMIFSAPMAFLEDLICSLKYLKKQKWGYPWGFELKPERELDNNYAELGKKMGMDYVK